MSRPLTPVIDRVLARIHVDANGCWIFRGATTVGYGVIGRGPRSEGIAYTHRVAYEHFVGPIPAGLHIDHLCRVRRCCNPEHLEAVTQAVNNQRAMAVRQPITHCKYGHEFTPDNTARNGRQRLCLACRRRRYLARRAA